VRRLAADGLLPAGLLVAPPALLSQLEPLVAGHA
jgi:hypothetical protein